jgi:hypothetical protein
MSEAPLPRGTAARAVARCVAVSTALLARGQVSRPDTHVGRRLVFGDGTSARVYRETRVDRTPREPCVLVVSFRLRGVGGRRAHALFRAESLLNTPLFVGFPGFVSKLWLDADERGAYRGLYEWDGAGAGDFYAGCLWRVLELVSVPGSIHYRVLRGLHRDEVLEDPSVLERYAPAGERPWWRVLAA